MRILSILKYYSAYSLVFGIIISDFSIFLSTHYCLYYKLYKYLKDQRTFLKIFLTKFAKYHFQSCVFKSCIYIIENVMFPFYQESTDVEHREEAEIKSILYLTNDKKSLLYFFY